MTEPLLSVRDLVVRFHTRDGQVYAVNGVSFDVRAGETIGLVGESGSGKSVTSLAIMGLLPRYSARIVSGQIMFEGKDLTQLEISELRPIRGAEISMVFQDPMSSLNPVLTIGEQVVETIQAHAHVSAAAARERVVEILRSVGIPNAKEQLRRYPHQFSGGMRQRVLIAIALALEPRLLIADEPTTALDVTVQAQVLELLRELTTRLRTALVLISHDLGIMARMTQRVVVMYAGMVVESAPTAELLRRPRHPYTVGLLNSSPRLTGGLRVLQPIDGAPPDLVEPPTGCPFTPRCRWRLPHCATVMPALVDTGGGHLLACHNPVDQAEVAAGRPLRSTPV